MRYAVLFICALTVFATAAVTPSPVWAAGVQEKAYWNSIRNSRNPEDFETYLYRYPYGDWTEQAERRANNLRARDDRRRREDALGLSRGQRREVEARLSRAGFFPGSINGEFNRDTRTAIRDFRVAYGLPRHRFLDAQMIRVLVRNSGNEYAGGASGFSRNNGGSARDGDIAAGVVVGALLLGGIILLAD